MAAVARHHVMPEQHRVFEGVRQLVRPGAPRAVEVQHRGDVETLPVEAEAIAQHHLHRRTLGGDRQPDRRTVSVHRDRHRVDGRAEPAEPPSRLADQGIDLRHRLRMAEALFDDRDPQSAGASAQRLAIGLCRGAVLPRVEAVGAGQYFEQQRIVLDRRGHRAGVVQCQLDRHDAGVGHEPMGRLHAIDAAERGRDADRPALVAAQCHRHLARSDHGCTSR